MIFKENTEQLEVSLESIGSEVQLLLLYKSSPLLGEYISRKNYMLIRVVHFARFTYLNEETVNIFLNGRVF